MLHVTAAGRTAAVTCNISWGAVPQTLKVAILLTAPFVCVIVMSVMG